MYRIRYTRTEPEGRRPEGVVRVYIAKARTRTSLNPEVTPKRYAPWLAKQRKLVQ